MNQAIGFYPCLKIYHEKFSFHYLISNPFFIFLFMFLFSIFFSHASKFRIQDIFLLCYHHNFSYERITLLFLFIIFSAISFYFTNHPKKVYLINFSCYKPAAIQMCNKQQFLALCVSNGNYTEESMAFKMKILEKSGLGPKTYAPKALLQIPINQCLAEARNETETIIFEAIDELFAKTGLNPKDLGIIIVNSSVFNPTPSLSTTIINRYKLRGNILSYNLGGMGCSAGLISIDMAKNLLQVHPNCYALVISTENMTSSWYVGNNRPMLIPNCIFRVGGAAILLSNRLSDCHRSKYQLLHTVRTHKGADNKSYNCVFQQEDEVKKSAITLSKNLMVVAGEALKTNITTLGPLVLPISDQLLYLATYVARKFLKMKMIKPHVFDFKKAFQHFCIHPGGKAVLDEIEERLELTKWHMEPSQMTLYRFGNTSSSCLWYELAYSEAKGRIKKGEKIWQIGFGSGFKCNSVVWVAKRGIDPVKEKNSWSDEIDDFPKVTYHLSN